MSIVRSLVVGIAVLLVGCTSETKSTASSTGADGGPSGNGGNGSDGGTGGPGTPANAVTLGADLAQEPTSTYACGDGYPIQTNPSFPQPFYLPGAPSCTVLAFVASATPSPGSGTAVSATIKVGATTGPMRFVRMRLLFQNGPAGTQCCSVEQYGEIFTPTANASTTVPLNFRMTEDHVPAPNDPTIIANDAIALEVLSPTVPIPGYWPANGGAVTGIADYVYFPALAPETTPAPSTALVNYSGSFSGFIPLFSIAYVPG